MPSPQFHKLTQVCHSTQLNQLTEVKYEQHCAMMVICRQCSIRSSSTSTQSDLRATLAAMVNACFLFYTDKWTVQHSDQTERMYMLIWCYTVCI